MTHDFLSKRVALYAAFLAVAGIFPPRLSAQLVRDPAPSSAQPQSSTPNSSASQAPSGKRRLSQEIQLTGDQLWSDTGIDVQAGEHALITATGKLRYSDAQDDNGPEGRTRGFSDLVRILPYNDAGRGALIGRIGDADIALPFLIGARKDAVAPVNGRLSVGINQMKDDTGVGTYTVRIELYPLKGDVARVVARQVTSMPGIDNSLFTRIPRRIADKDGNPGDMVNFLILGSEAAMQRTFTTAGWVKVDADVEGAALRALLESLSMKSYLTMPMSQLYLFGRAQDYGWARAEPIAVVASRNHLRIWKASWRVKGQTLWVGAATHDIGFERDQRNDSITHKIDPDIDLERDYLEKTLSATGLVSEVAHFLPVDPMKEAKTATGGSFQSNGQVLVLKLDESTKNGAVTSSQTPLRSTAR
jgi:LssY C-terminus